MGLASNCSDNRRTNGDNEELIHKGRQIYMHRINLHETLNL